MKKKILLVPVALLLVISLLATGCPAPPGKKAIVIGVQPATCQVSAMIAMDKGWWEEGLAKYGVIYVGDKLFPSGPPEMTAMLAGAIDVAYVGTTPPISAIGKGLKAKIVASVDTRSSGLVLSPEAAKNYIGPESLEGLRIATFPPGSIQDTVLKKWLADNNVVGVDIRAMGPGDAVIALEVGGVDGVFLPPPRPAWLVLAGTGVKVADSSDMWPGHSCCVIVVTDELIRDYPEIVEEIVRIHIKATQLIYSNPKEAVEIFQAKIGLTEEVLVHSFITGGGYWQTDPRGIVESTLAYAKTLYDMGVLDKLLTEEDLFDFTFYDKVVKEMDYSDAMLDLEAAIEMLKNP